MTYNAYITLTNSDSSLIKKFRVASSGFKPSREKLGTRRMTVTGAIDNQVGPVVRSWDYVLAVYETDPTDPAKSDGDTEGYGTLAHLHTFFDYNDPGGTPSNLITLTDFDGTTHTVTLDGRIDDNNINPTVIEGVQAKFHVPVTMRKTTAET